MASPGWRSRLMTVSRSVGVLVAVVGLGCTCPTGSQQPAARPSQQPAARPSRREVARAQPTAGAPGIAGRYRVGTRRMRFLEPAPAGPAGQRLGPRPLATLIWYPLARRAAAARPAAGRFPLLLFAPGFMQCAGPYAPLLRAWASAGYVVAAVDFPRTSCQAGPTADEADLVHQPADLSYLLSRLLALSARPHDLLSGRLNRRQIAAAGQSDGGDAVAALAANTCCADPRLAAVAVLSGAEWPPMPGRYFTRPAPPMLLVQGSADAINPAQASRQLYRAHWPRGRYYLDLPGASHMIPYTGTNPAERLVALVTLAFFDRYLLGQPSALTAMTRGRILRGNAILVTGRRLPP